LSLMAKFPDDAPKRKVIKALERLGFHIIREKEHVSMKRENQKVMDLKDTVLDGQSSPFLLRLLRR